LFCKNLEVRKKNIRAFVAIKKETRAKIQETRLKKGGKQETKEKKK